MPIADAISALSPSIWYKLDEASGTTANNSGSQNNNGTYSGSLTQGQPGPDIGTFATRLYVGGNVVSGVMDLTSLVNQTLALMVSMDASGSIGTVYPIVNIGDPTNRVIRGPRLFENHSGGLTPQYGAGYAGLGTLLGAAPQPVRFWHWIAATFASGTNGLKLYIDGTLVTQGTISSPVNPIATDPLLIQCDEPAMVAHVCWWGSVLTQAQIQTVSNQISTWPYSQPINLPPSGTGGGGGLTPPQSSLLTQIGADTQQLLSNWAGYTSTTLPSLQDLLNSISSQITNVQQTLDTNIGPAIQVVAQLAQSIQQGITVTLQSVTGAIQTSVGQALSVVGNVLSDRVELSNGPTCEHLDQIVIGPFEAVKILITSWPEGLTYYAPDADFVRPDYATVNLYVGSDHLARWGVHQVDWISPTFPPTKPVDLLIFTVNYTPPDTHVIVDWAPGVCGQVWVLKAPPGQPGPFP